MICSFFSYYFTEGLNSRPFELYELMVLHYYLLYCFLMLLVTEVVFLCRLEYWKLLIGVAVLNLSTNREFIKLHLIFVEVK